MPRYVVGVPAHFSLESIGYLSSVIAKPPSRVSWAELLNRRWKSRVALQSDPAVALVDAGQAVSALGLMRFGNLGSMTTAEIDRLVRILSRYRKQGQFRAVWSGFNDSVNLMASKDVAISPIWPSAAARLAAEGINVRYAVPPEGYRGSCSSVGDLGSRRRRCEARRLLRVPELAVRGFLRSGHDAAGILRRERRRLYPPGSELTAASSRPTSASFRPAEYDYWYRGQPAARGLPDLMGKIGTIRKGSVREGGGLRARACRIASWSTYFHTTAYQVKRFNDFLSA